MASHEDSPNTEFEQASSNLDEGLKTCRAVVRSYRELLVGDHLVATTAADNDDQAIDQPPAPLPQ